jgi:WD40 repeat protein
MVRLVSLLLVLLVVGCESSAQRERAVRTTFRAYRNAVESRDLAALRGVVAAERRTTLDSPDAEHAVAMIAAMSPWGPEIVETTVTGDTAELALAGDMEGAPMTGKARLRREDGEWKLAKEEWSIELGGSAFGASGSGNFAARLKTGPSAAPSAAMRLVGHEGSVTSVAFSPDGSTLVTASYDDKTIRSWDLWSESEISMVACERRPTDMVVASDGAVIVGDAYGNVTRYPLHGGELREPERVTGEAERISRIAIHPEGAVVASTGWEDPVRLWDLAGFDGNEELGRSESMRGIAFSPDGRLLAAGGRDNTFTVWNLEKKWAPFSRRTHEVSWAAEGSDVWAIAFSHDGRLLATGHMDSSISLWDVKKRKELKNWYVRDASTEDVEFCPDGTLLATAQQDGAVYLWDVETAQGLVKLAGHEGGVKSLAFSPANPELLASGGEDGAVVIWQ